MAVDIADIFACRCPVWGDEQAIQWTRCVDRREKYFHELRQSKSLQGAVWQGSGCEDRHGIDLCPIQSRKESADFVVCVGEGRANAVAREKEITAKMIQLRAFGQERVGLLQQSNQTDSRHRVSLPRYRRQTSDLSQAYGACQYQ